MYVLFTTRVVRWSNGFGILLPGFEHHQAEAEGRSVYPALLAEIPAEPSSVLVLPHFAPTGPPRFITDSAGVMAGLHLGTRRGEVLKGIIEGVAFYLKELVDSLPATGIKIDNFRAVGGGSRSDAWVQTCADIFGLPFTRPVVTEAGALGAAIIAGVGSGVFENFTQAVAAMVKLERDFRAEPAHARTLSDPLPKIPATVAAHGRLSA